MNTVIYHEINSHKADNALREGLKREEDGEKTNPETKKIDTFLDTHLPEGVAVDLSRRSVTYGYMCDGDKIIDISTGDSVQIQDFKRKGGSTLLRIEIDPTKCYVSDLDLYDTLMRAMELEEQDSTLENLADQYWHKVIRLDRFEQGTIRRPEVMVTYDIPPASISVVS